MEQFSKISNGRALYAEPNRVWIAKGMSFYAIDYRGKRVSRKYTVGSYLERVIGVFRVLRQGLRIGIHHLIPLKNGNLLVVAKGIVYIVDGKDGKVVNTFCDFQGNKPGHQGLCVTPNGTIFFAEYILNTHRDKNVNIYRSVDDGGSFHIVKSFEAGDIRHLHFVKWDQYEECLWLGTGDYGKNNNECRLYKSTDNGETWSLVGYGSQDWRAIGVCFTKDYLLWGTDAGSTPDENHLIRMNRKSCELEVLSMLEGPCHGCASYADGRVFISTGVEGGENEKDNYARMKRVGGESLVDVLQLKKDIFPLVLQYGVMRFPLGTENCDRICFTAMGLKGNGEVVLCEKR